VTVAAQRTGVAVTFAVALALLVGAPICVQAAERSPKASAQRSPAAAAAKGPADADGCPPPDEIVHELQARYDTTTAFRADFMQTVTVTSVGAAEESRGTVAFKKPGKMRWDFRSPDEQQIISNGTTIWIYQPADRQVIKAPFRAAFVSSTPVSFLTGVGRVTDDFRPQRDPRGCTPDRLYVKLQPKESQDLGALALGVDRSTYDIVEAAVTDPIGNVTTLVFTNLQRNVDIPESDFQFTVPAGIDVINAPGGGVPPSRE
jgi:outer membrane lipoprotein carrier protein